MEFVKMHGLGNDFVIMEDFSGKVQNYEVLARRLCDRNFGVGADGLVLLQHSQKAACRMRIFNADGSEAEMCGNAVRCIGKYLYERGLVGETVILLETYNNLLTLRLQVEGATVSGVEVDMGEPILESDLVPVSGEKRQVISEALQAVENTFLFTAVSMGNPHCVIFCDDVAAVPLTEWGPPIEVHPFFPRKANVEFVEVKSPELAVVRVWERGVGPTLACGTGACAVLVAGVINGRLKREAEIQLPGGALTVEWREDNHVYMTGPAVEVFSGRLSLQFDSV
jgi:diaminopimelate epimerase